MLTSYGGTAISYDAIGNPTNWINANNLTWKARELQSLNVTGGPSVAFEYNSDGIRTKKTVGGSVIHNYTLDGTKIIRETVTNNGAAFYDFYYLYDETGSVQGFIYNNNYYYYQKNLQGDVIRILNYSGNVVVEYTYDAWGKVLSVTGSQASTIGQYNPFRYRSYYYDVETGFYYLQSRYYDPTVGRFLNADHPELIGTNGSAQGFNLIAYCNNNPIVFSDETGFALRANTKIVNDGGGTQTISSESESSLSPPYEADKFGWSGTVVVLKTEMISVPGVAKVTPASENLEGTLGPYNQLRKMTKGIPELEVHHLIEFRFCSAGGELARYNRYNAPAVIVSKANHRALTNAFRTKFPYGKTDYSSMESSGILSFFKNEYSNGGKPEWVDYICSYYD